MPKEILTRHPVTLHVPPKPYTSGLFFWKCRACGAATEDDNQPGPHLCKCGGVMDWTPHRRK